MGDVTRANALQEAILDAVGSPSGWSAWCDAMVGMSNALAVVLVDACSAENKPIEENCEKLGMIFFERALSLAREREKDLKTMST